MARKQLSIAGTEEPTIQEIDTAAEAYIALRNARMKATEHETESKTALIEVMKKHGLSVYRFEDDDGEHVVTLADKTNVKVTDVEEEEGAI